MSEILNTDNTGNDQQPGDHELSGGEVSGGDFSQQLDISSGISERRQKTDRRGTGRQGKYDRRRNRCGSCYYFELAKSFCAYHKAPMLAEDFACPFYQPQDKVNK